MHNCSIIILGATGDLARKKLFPALFDLFTKEKLQHFIIVGAAIDRYSNQEFIELIKKQVNPNDQTVWEVFAQKISYQSIDFKKNEDFDILAKVVEQEEKRVNLSGNRLVYCSTASFFYCDITKSLAQSILLQKKEKNDPIWNRIVYEKPFGNDLASAQEINTCIKQYFNEHQIFRIDHYLTKEFVSNIELVRFTNIVFEPLWNNRYIDQVQIVFDEDIGLEGRGGFYDKYGALADVVQNHMLEMVALVGMESPEKLTGEFIQKERVRVLEKIKVVDAILGQYEGYQKEKDVKQDSQTETFAQLFLRIENHRWAGVPFVLRTGKYVQKKETAIYIKFKQVDCLLAVPCPSESNFLTIEISPNPIFALTLNAKKPGKSQEIMPVQMKFVDPAFDPEKMPDAYQTLIEEVLKGDHSVCVRFDEIESSWKIIDAIHEQKHTVHTYKKGSKGPTQAVEQFDKKHGIRWKS